MTARAKKPAVPAAEICLYGTSAAGSGWIACIRDGTPSGKMLGDGGLTPGRSMTEAVWLAVDELRGAGVARGLVRIFASGGQSCADVEIGDHIPYFGDLKWQAAPGYVLPAEQLLRAAGVTP